MLFSCPAAVAAGASNMRYPTGLKARIEMDMGIRGKTALVCAASKGLGKGCAMALAEEGVQVVITARGRDALEETARDIYGRTGVKPVTVVGDITTEEGRSRALAACPSPDILINNAGGPPTGDFRAWSREDWIKALGANMLTPIELIKATIDGMIARRFGRIVNITSGAVKMPIAELGLSNGARSGLTGFVAGVARQVVQHNVTINALLPGPFDTDRLRSNFEANAKRLGKTAAELAKARADSNPAKRFGGIEEFGAACAFLASVHAGYITGQNILMDGGAYPGAL